MYELAVQCSDDSTMTAEWKQEGNIIGIIIHEFSALYTDYYKLSDVGLFKESGRTI